MPDPKRGMDYLSLFAACSVHSFRIVLVLVALALTSLFCRVVTCGVCRAASSARFLDPGYSEPSWLAREWEGDPTTRLILFVCSLRC